MQKHILLTGVFILVLIMLFYYPKPTELLEQESLRTMVTKTSINKTKDKNNITTDNTDKDYSKTEQSELSDQLLDTPKAP